ncbi:unnamed protein product [Symbiodinium natans]|uniref:Ubiquitin-like domain-containing protein n=1 Tax=Symbiodinium natans TaxID=878477 RepID=A0A812KUG4_9DINO|nr:unnamed protein product [Symbiodinium natans]
MTMSVCVRLLSGRAVDIEVEEGSSVHEVQQQAQQMLGVRGRLVKSDGTTLASMKCTVLQAGLSDDESLTLQASPALRVLAGSFAAFAGVLNDDTLVLWGEEMPFGSSEYESGQLKNVCQVAATTDAFAALLWDGSVVTWGDKRCGGDSSAVKEQLRDVKQIVGSRHVTVLKVLQAAINAEEHSAAVAAAAALVDAWKRFSSTEAPADEFVSRLHCARTSE